MPERSEEQTRREVAAQRRRLVEKYGEEEARWIFDSLGRAVQRARENVGALQQGASFLAEWVAANIQDVDDVAAHLEQLRDRGASSTMIQQWEAVLDRL